MDRDRQTGLVEIYRTLLWPNELQFQWHMSRIQVLRELGALVESVAVERQKYAVARGYDRERRCKVASSIAAHLARDWRTPRSVVRGTWRTPRSVVRGTWACVRIVGGYAQQQLAL